MGCFTELEVSHLKPVSQGNVSLCTQERIPCSVSPRFCSYRNSLAYGHILTICFHHHIALFPFVFYAEMCLFNPLIKTPVISGRSTLKIMQAKLISRFLITHPQKTFLCSTSTDDMGQIWMSFQILILVYIPGQSIFFHVDKFVFL